MSEDEIIDQLVDLFHGAEARRVAVAGPGRYGNPGVVRRDVRGLRDAFGGGVLVVARSRARGADHTAVAEAHRLGLATLTYEYHEGRSQDEEASDIVRRATDVVVYQGEDSSEEAPVVLLAAQEEKLRMVRCPRGEKVDLVDAMVDASESV